MKPTPLTPAEKRARDKQKLLDSLTPKQSHFSVPIEPRKDANERKFSSGIFRSN